MSRKQNKRVATMQINSLEKMEDIVLKNKSLSWEGWNVVELIKHPAAMFRTNAARVDGVWYIKNIFTVERDGWRIPAKYVR